MISQLFCDILFSISIPFRGCSLDSALGLRARPRQRLLLPNLNVMLDMPQSFTVILCHMYWRQLEAFITHFDVHKAEAASDKIVFEPSPRFAGDKPVADNLFTEGWVKL